MVFNFKRNSWPKRKIEKTQSFAIPSDLRVSECTFDNSNLAFELIVMIKWYGYICWCELSITFNRWNWWWRRATLAHCIKKDEAEIRFAMICHDYSIALQIINDYLKWMCVRTLFLLCSFANYIRNFLMNIFFLFSFATHTIVWTQLFYSACIAKLEIWFDDLFFTKKKYTELLLKRLDV